MAKTWLIADAALMLLMAACSQLTPVKGRRALPSYETQGRVWQRMELRDRHGVRYRLTVIVPGPRADEYRGYTFTDEHSWRHFQVDDCAVVVVEEGRASLRSCP